MTVEIAPQNLNQEVLDVKYDGKIVMRITDVAMSDLKRLYGLNAGAEVRYLLEKDPSLGTTAINTIEESLTQYINENY